jgi:hypothetical protein
MNSIQFAVFEACIPKLDFTAIGPLLGHGATYCLYNVLLFCFKAQSMTCQLRFDATGDFTFGRSCEPAIELAGNLLQPGSKISTTEKYALHCGWKRMISHKIASENPIASE